MAADGDAVNVMLEAHAGERIALPLPNAGDRATLVRKVNGRQQSYNLSLGDLVKDGDMSANVPLQPGDVIIIPQSYF